MLLFANYFMEKYDALRLLVQTGACVLGRSLRVRMGLGTRLEWQNASPITIESDVV